tara:strand:- start:458 stop:625 length:168 start_codon:yes stop_codon:yes gene_type:complete
MKTYSAYVYGGTGRRVLVEAINQQEAEAQAIEEFIALVGADTTAEVIDISEAEDV